MHSWLFLSMRLRLENVRFVIQEHTVKHQGATTCTQCTNGFTTTAQGSTAASDCKNIFPLPITSTTCYTNSINNDWISFHSVHCILIVHLETYQSKSALKTNFTPIFYLFLGVCIAGYFINEAEAGECQICDTGTIQWSTRCNYLYTMYSMDSLQLPKDQLLHQIVRTFSLFLSHLPHVTTNSINNGWISFHSVSLYPWLFI